jgi:large subunit ribosomal protein L29
MKVTKFKEELAQLSIAQLQEKLEHLRRDLFGLKLNARTSHVKNHAQFKQIRKDIARVMTFMNQKDQTIETTR